MKTVAIGIVIVGIIVLVYILVRRSTKSDGDSGSAPGGTRKPPTNKH